jgi:hypothetical protein
VFIACPGTEAEHVAIFIGNGNHIDAKNISGAYTNFGGVFMKKTVIFALLSMLLCTILLVGCGSDEPTAEQKKEEMDKAFLAFAAQITRFKELSMKVGSTFEGVEQKKINVSQAKDQYESISATFLEVEANLKKIGTPQWLSSENKSKFDEMKKHYVEAAEAMSSYAKTFANCPDGKCATEDRKKILEYGSIRKDRLTKGGALMTYFADGNWKK